MKGRVKKEVIAAPDLFIVDQSSAGWEPIKEDGKQKTSAAAGGGRIFQAVKNGLFVVTLGSTALDLSKVPVTATLVYADNPTRAVETAKTAPLTVKGAASEDGKKKTMECRIKVLSSKHDDSTFSVLFRVLNGETGTPFDPDVFVVSGAVRIVSKPEQLQNTGDGHAALKAQKVRGEYAEQLVRIRDTLKEQRDAVQELVLNAEERLRRSGRANAILTDNFFPPAYAPAPAPASAGKRAAPSTGEKGKKRGRKPKREGNDDDEGDDDWNADANRQKGGPTKAAKTEPGGAAGQRDQFDGCFFRFIASFNDLDSAQKAEQFRAAIRQLAPARAALWKSFLEVMIQSAGPQGLGQYAAAATPVAATPTPAAPPGSSAPALNASSSNANVVKVELCSCEGCPYRAKVLDFDYLFANTANLI